MEICLQLSRVQPESSRFNKSTFSLQLVLTGLKLYNLDYSWMHLNVQLSLPNQNFRLCKIERQKRVFRGNGCCCGQQGFLVQINTGRNRHLGPF